MFLAGLGAGAAGDRGSVRTPPVRGGYTVLAGDLHVHSFPGDGALPPWDIAHEASRRRLDVVALTNHNAMFSWRLARVLGWTASTPGVLILPGDEVTSVGFHVAAIGLHERVAWHRSIPEVAAAIHAQGGVAIGAHPAGSYYRAYDAAAYQALDGIEAAHPVMFIDDKSREEIAQSYVKSVAAHPSIAAIGSSDFHTWAPIGLCRTYLFVRAADAGGVLEAIRAGRTVACDGQGFTVGPPPLASLVAADCRADASAPPSEVRSLSLAGAFLTWLALLALVVLGFE